MSELRTVQDYVDMEQSKPVRFNAWTMQSVVYELLRNYFSSPKNTLEALGYPLKLKYDREESKSDITLTISFKYDDHIAGKRPAIYVGRGALDITQPTIGQAVAANPQEGETTKMTINRCPVTVTVIAAPLMTAELLIDWVKTGLMYHQTAILNDFRLRRFKVVNISKPEIFKENKDYFVITLTLDTAFDEGWVITRKDLKIKTVAFKIYTDIVNDTLIE